MFIRDGYSDNSEYGALPYSHEDINLFISVSCTSDV